MEHSTPEASLLNTKDAQNVKEQNKMVRKPHRATNVIGAIRSWDLPNIKQKPSARKEVIMK